MTETTESAKNTKDRVIITAFIARGMRDRILEIAADNDLSLSDVLRIAIKEYTEKQN